MSDSVDGLLRAEKIAQKVMDDFYEKADSTRLYKFRDRWTNNAEGASACLDMIQAELAKVREEE